MECENISLNYSSKPRKSISILVVDDDTTCLYFVAALLKKLKYEVVTAKHPNDALCALRIKGGFDLVVSDVHMPDMNGFQLQAAITHEFNLPVVLMSVDSKEEVFSNGMESSSALLFISKPVSPNDLKDLWQFASIRNKRSTQVVIEDINSKQHIIINKDNNSKRKSSAISKAADTKKPKVIWTNALHYRFLEAIRSIGLERSVPKKILQVMNVPGLTRENVASHLQKYRMFLKRVSDASYNINVEIGDDDESSKYSSSRTLSRHSAGQLISLTTNMRMRAAATYSGSINDQVAAGSILMQEDVSNAKHQLALHESRTSQDHYYQLQQGFNHHHHFQNNSFFLNPHHQPPPHSLYCVDRFSDHVNNVDQDRLPSNLSFIENEFCSLYDQQQHHLSVDDQPNFIQNQNAGSSHQYQYTIQTNLFCHADAINNSSYHQPALYQQVQGGIQSAEFDSAAAATSQLNKPLRSPNYERDDDDVLESLLAFGAFGEDHIQTLEGI